MRKRIFILRNLNLYLCYYSFAFLFIHLRFVNIKLDYKLIHFSFYKLEIVLVCFEYYYYASGKTIEYILKVSLNMFIKNIQKKNI